VAKSIIDKEQKQQSLLNVDADTKTSSSPFIYSIPTNPGTKSNSTLSQVYQRLLSDEFVFEIVK
jgi:hypothetical protein